MAVVVEWGVRGLSRGGLVFLWPLLGDFPSLSENDTPMSSVICRRGSRACLILRKIDAFYPVSDPRSLSKGS